MFVGAAGDFKLEIKMPMDEIRRLTTEAVKSLESRSVIRRKLADTLKLLIQRDFLRKSLGQTGDDGIRWKPLKPSTVKQKGTPVIGIETWDLYQSLNVTTGGGSLADVTASFDSPHAEFFDATRPLLPSVAPDAWTKALGTEVEDWAQKQVREKLLAWLN